MGSELLLLDEIECLLPMRGLDHMAVNGFQSCANQVAAYAIIIYDENFFHNSATPYLMTPAQNQARQHEQRAP
jgi:hypothetical protein